MRVGDLVIFESNDPCDDRHVGTILKFDVYRGNDRLWGPLRDPEPIVEVLWNTGCFGWILRDRVRIIK